MNLRDLHYFLVLAEVKHFGTAAKRCFVSQPTLSMQIRKLEETLGVSLFERTNKRVFLTDHGETLLPKAKKILLLVDEIKDLAQQSQDPFSGALRLGVIPTVAPYLLPIIMPVLQAEFPNLKIWLIEEQTHRLTQQLKDGDLDAAIMAQPIEGPFKSHHLFNESFYFACSHTHPLAAQAVITTADLIGQHVLLLEEGHCLREQAMAVCQIAKANEIADFTATSLETLRFMVQAGMGVTLLPELAAQAHSSPLLRCIPFEVPAPYRALSLFARLGSPKEVCIEAIANKIIQAVGSAMA